MLKFKISKLAKKLIYNQIPSKIKFRNINNNNNKFKNSNNKSNHYNNNYRNKNNSSHNNNNNSNRHLLLLKVQRELKIKFNLKINIVNMLKFKQLNKLQINM
jgi:hypothetical protein